MILNFFTNVKKLLINNPVSESENVPVKSTESLSTKITDKFGEFFYRLGYLIASNPWKTIFSVLAVIATVAPGILLIRAEKNPLNLWVPLGVKFRQDTDWLIKNFEIGHREQGVLYTARNILEPKNLKKIAILNKELEKFRVTLRNGTEISWRDVCFKIPVIIDVLGSDEEDDDEDEDYIDEEFNQTTTDRPYNPAINLDKKLFCSIYNNLPFGCRQKNLIELWSFNVSQFDQARLEDILYKLNTIKINPVTGYDVDFIPLLSGIVRNESGYILGASSMLSNYFLHVNFSDINHDKVGNLVGTESFGSEPTLLWETKFKETILRIRPLLEDDDFKIYFTTERSFGDITESTFGSETEKLMISAILMFVYMQTVFSKFSWIDFRFWLGSGGLLSIGIAAYTTCSICALIGITFAPINMTFCLLLMGLGVDDMFVMMACWRKVQFDDSDRTIPEKIGLMLQYAGVSITLTSMTDLVAFLVGTTTAIPAMRSYCIYSAIGVLLTYLLVITLYVALFALDEQRIVARRNAMIPCYITHGEKSVQLCCDKNLMERSIKFVYSKIVLTWPGKIVVILLSIGLTVYGCINVFNLEKYVDNKWVIPKSSDLYKYDTRKAELYPSNGMDAEIILSGMDIRSSMEAISRMTVELSNRTDLVNDLDSWSESFKNFVEIYHQKNVFSTNITEDEWRIYFSQFLFSKEGGRYQHNFKFSTKLECGEKVPNIDAALINFFYVPQNGTKTYAAKKEVENIVSTSSIGGSNSTEYVSTWSKIYGIWSHTEVVDVEAVKGLLLAMVCVIFCTGVLILNFQMCFWIFICVTLTLIGIAGGMHFFSLKLDLMSNLAFLLAVGLCVDYAAHVGHTFLTISRGTRNERALESMNHIAGAILNGAGSTLLSMSMLSISDVLSSVMLFKDVCIVIGTGLYYGIFFLPVVLSMVGPAPYHKEIFIDTRL